MTDEPPRQNEVNYDNPCAVNVAPLYRSAKTIKSITRSLDKRLSKIALH